MPNHHGALLLDFYELTMANSYFEQGREKEHACFDYYFRRVPDDGGYAIFAGLQQVLDYAQNLRFNDADIEFLRQKGAFSEGFLNYLRNFRFSGDIYAFAEGSVVFPTEPLLSVYAPLIECQLLETFFLLSLNHQSLIATKAARIVSVAGGRPVLEFGARRAHGGDAAMLGARAAYIGGASGTATTLAEQRYGIPSLGTMAHSYVQSYASEYEAFAAYAQTCPENTVLLVDTYNTLKSGIPNAIKVHEEFLAPNGHSLKGIRIDSGDLTYLSQRARDMLDAAGLTETKITVSNSLDEYVIKDLVNQGAAIDAFGVGERLITARSEPVFGGVYKIVAQERDGKMEPRIKISENVIKTTTPGFKQVYRLYDEANMAIADLVTLRDEEVDGSEPYRLFDPEHTWKHKMIKDFTLQARLNPVIVQGERIDEQPDLAQIRAHTQAELARIWPEVQRLENPHGYYVDLSKPLWQLKQDLISEYSRW
ncbi:nicotinate phosphoribosyltransferase [Suttonella sp. R2A3]|uniref:nicotinate phosphoribosyltransferase n=1 Tax=Suttonella sp. R2A3 TaxID=2908648 RepID=UPI001F3FEE98|nr:nicotinate phosphoribosyltransferase [Suttonella sp. R2A3]UJF24589.1 nicotinate phosphoribosyltransferase [Suttonella sp. R2A3]